MVIQRNFAADSRKSCCYPERGLCGVLEYSPRLWLVFVPRCKPAKANTVSGTGGADTSSRGEDFTLPWVRGMAKCKLREMLHSTPVFFYSPSKRAVAAGWTRLKRASWDDNGK
jgi:hypothetical protein